MATRTSPRRNPTRSAGVPGAISAATTPFCSIQRTPSSTSRHVARDATFAAPRHSRTASTSSGSRARIHRSVEGVSNNELNRSSNQMESKNAPKIAGRQRGPPLRSASFAGPAWT